MIFDKLINAENYIYNDRFKIAFEFLKSADTLPCGRYDISDGVYANIMEFNTKSKQDLKTEGHLNYADIQYIAKGEETMGFYCGRNYNEIEPYDADRDIFFVDARLQYVNLKHGEFALFFPSDLHMPSIGNGEKVKKVVVKVKVK